LLEYISITNETIESVCILNGVNKYKEEVRMKWYRVWTSDGKHLINNKVTYEELQELIFALGCVTYEEYEEEEER